MADPKWTVAPLKLWNEYEVTGAFAATAPNPPWTPQRPHMGLDIGVPEEFWVYAPCDGTIVEFGNNGSFGLGRCIDVPNTPYYSLFAHMSRVDVPIGQQVKAGDRLGLTGRTSFDANGNQIADFGAHLHWQVCTDKNFPRDDGLPRDQWRNVDPLRFKAWDVAQPPPVSPELAEIRALNAAIILRYKLFALASDPDLTRVEKAAAILRREGLL